MKVTHVVGNFGDDFEVVARLTKLKAAEETPNFGAGTRTRETAGGDSRRSLIQGIRLIVCRRMLNDAVKEIEFYKLPRGPLSLRD
jgi:hypothetical protein